MRTLTLTLALLLPLLAACTWRAELPENVMIERELVGDVRETTHRDRDDLLSAGLGLEGLRAKPPAFADAVRPTAEELRRRAIHASTLTTSRAERRGVIQPVASRGVPP